MIDVKAFREKWSFLSEKEMYLACSGGVDSMVLLHLLQKSGFKPTLLHVNYMLRGAESEEDELFIRAYALQENLRLETLKSDLSGHKSGIQEKARKIRYDWFAGKTQAENAILLLAHHEDDQLETFYMNLARKSGNSGLACMPEIQGKLLRPLLPFSKEEIYAFAREKKLSWREDSSNADNKYTRNRLRNEFLPFLEKQIPELRTSVSTLIALFQENKKEVELSVEKLIANIRETHVLSLHDWRVLTPEQRIAVLKAFAFAPAQVEAVEKLEQAQKGKSVFSGTHQLIREADGFSLKGLHVPGIQSHLLLEPVRELPAHFSKEEIYLDAAKISGELILRRWKTGDRISPLGMKGSKLISDIISDAKIPHVRREEILVLEDQDTIHWCVGLSIGRKALAGENSKVILKCKITTP